MSTRNILFGAAGIVIIAVIVGIAVWKPLYTSVSPLPTETTESDQSATDVAVSHSAAAQTVKEGTHYVSLIRYNGSTFTPRILVVNKGESVRFVNSSNLTMRIQADSTSTTTTPSMYQQAQSVGKNGIYELSFVNAGIWIVQNLNDNSSDNTAVIYVK